MRQQPSKKAIELRLEWLNKALGQPLEPWTRNEAGNQANAGCFVIDRQLGGYRIEQMSEAGGSNPIFGHQRMNKTALCDILEAILVAIKLARNETHGGAWPIEGERIPDYKAALAELTAACQKHRWHVNGDEPDAIASAVKLLKG